MEIRTLRYFLAVAREENMTRAAEILHVTQPTLSKQLKSLEDELGKKLFTRHSFSIALTDEGILLRNRAEDLVSMADKIEQEFFSLDDITGGNLYFGLPLFCSQHSWENDIRPWAKEKFSQLHLEGSFRLAYNASMFTKEGLGILLTLNNLIDISKESGLVFRPLAPRLEMKMYMIWNKYQSFTPIAERFMKQVRSSFASND